MNAATKVQNVKCPSCEVEAYPSMALNGKFALVPSCPACGYEHKDIEANDMAQTPVAPAEKKQTPAKVVAIRDSQFPNAEPPTRSLDLIGQVRERIQYLDLELARCAGYAAERKKLARMLLAAEKTK